MTTKVVTIAGAQTELDLERSGSVVRAGDQQIEVRLLGDQDAEITIGDRSWIVPFVRSGSRISFAFDGEIYNAEVTEKGARTRARHRDHSMSAPMPGVVTKILVQPGDVVQKGAPIAVIEAMKMEHQIVATHDGTVRAVHAKEGELVQPGLELVDLT